MSRYLDARGRWTLSAVEASALAAGPHIGAGRRIVRSRVLDAVCSSQLALRVQRTPLRPWRAALAFDVLEPAELKEDPFFGEALAEAGDVIDAAALIRTLMRDADRFLVSVAFPSLSGRGLWLRRDVGRIAEAAPIKGFRESPEGELAAQNLRQSLTRLRVELEKASRRAGKSEGNEVVIDLAVRGDVRSLVSELGSASILVPGSVPLIDQVLSESLKQGLVQATSVPSRAFAENSAGLEGLFRMRGEVSHDASLSLEEGLKLLEKTITQNM